MLDRWAEAGGDQQRAELVAVQGDRMGLVNLAADGGRERPGMLQELIFDRVLVEPGDGAPAAG